MAEESAKDIFSCKSCRYKVIEKNGVEMCYHKAEMEKTSPDALTVPYFCTTVKKCQYKESMI